MAEIKILAGHRHPFAGLMRLAIFLVESFGEGASGASKRHTILRPLRSCDRRLDLAEIKRNRVGENRIRRVVATVHALRLGIGVDECDARALAVRGVEINKRLLIDGEEPASRPI